jgi:hypothetical protein
MELPINESIGKYSNIIRLRLLYVHLMKHKIRSALLIPKEQGIKPPVNAQFYNYLIMIKI